MPSTSRPGSVTKRDHIRHAAQQLFVEEGFERTTTDAIAAAAHISKQTLYRYYPSKAELLLDILGRLSVNNPWRDPDAVPSVGSRAALEEQLLSIARGIACHTTDPTFLGLERVLIAEIPHFPHLAQRFHQTVTEPGFGIVLSLLECARAAGVVKVDPSPAVARLFLGPLLSYVYLDGLLTAEKDRRVPDPGEVRVLVRLFLDAVT